MRQQQQGLGRPIISAEANGYRFVAVGNEVKYSRDWKAFPDFLASYLKQVMGSAWGEVELGRPLKERHPLMQWYAALCDLQREHFDRSKTIQSMPSAGVVTCFYSLAYSLYLLKHNVELQHRLVRRLRDAKQFQGAYYELIVANCLLRSGFRLELEDETDGNAKHCEFSAISHVTGKRFWVEVKMRSVAGVLGKTILDGSNRRDPTEKLSTHLREALLKPAHDDRLIFVDLNAPSSGAGAEPSWLSKAIKRLDDRERNTPAEVCAYVFVTNFCFHHHLRDQQPSHEALAYGLNISDFGKVGPRSLSDIYRSKQRHLDAHRILDSFRDYPRLPSTFDGRLPSESLGGQPPVNIGETYRFPQSDGTEIVGTITTATVIESERAVAVVVRTTDGKSLILKELMSDEQFVEYEQHKDVYFGSVLPAGRKTESPFELFEWMVSAYSKTSKERLRELCKDAPDAEWLARLPRDDLVLELCERWVASMLASK